MLWALCRIRSQIGTKTPYWMASDKEEQEKQRDYIRQKVNILSFHTPGASFAIQQAVQKTSFFMTVHPDISASGYTRRGGFPVWTTNFGRGLFSIFYKTSKTDQTALKVIFTILQYSLYP